MKRKTTTNNTYLHHPKIRQSLSLEAPSLVLLSLIVTQSHLLPPQVTDICWKTNTVFLLIRAPSLTVAPPPEKSFDHDNIMNTS